MNTVDQLNVFGDKVIVVMRGFGRAGAGHSITFGEVR
jgi:hypothetical protein